MAWALAAGSLWLAANTALPAEAPRFQVPDGFSVRMFADDDLATNIYALTISPGGDVVVGGPGYIKTLHDDDGDGRADRQALFTDRVPEGVQGLEFDGNNLVCVGGPGVLYFRDEDGDGRADGEPELWVEFGKAQGGEHSAHGVRQGPDGRFYLIAGNEAGVSSQHASTPSSPVKRPIQGSLLVFGRGGAQIEVLAHGYRNPYDFDFDRHGRMFVYDSDGERDHYLPWYAPTRVFDVALGRHHGWLLPGWERSWNRPACFLDNVERVAETGRGSPTGVVCYRHRQFPPRYRDGLLLACWTYGRIYFLPLEAAGASVRSVPELFLQSVGAAGFAPVDLEVGPAGDVWVAVGGRGTRGGVVRVRYEPGAVSVRNEPADELLRVLRADQPLSSWSRARWTPLADQLGGERFCAAAANELLPTGDRIRAVEILVERFGGLPIGLARQIAERATPELVAAVARSLARREGDVEVEILLAKLTHAAAAEVQRAAWEALLYRAVLSRDERVVPAWEAAADSPDRRIRAAMIAVASGVGASNYRRLLPPTAGRITDRRAALMRLWIDGFDPIRGNAYLETCLRVFVQSREDEVRLEAVRLLQIAQGDIRHDGQHQQSVPGYQANEPERIGPEWKRVIGQVLAGAEGVWEAEIEGQDAAEAPVEHEVRPADAGPLELQQELRREVARTLAMLQVAPPGALEKVIGQVTPASHPTEDAHYLLVLGQLPGPRSETVTVATARAVAAVDGKMRRLSLAASRNWSRRIGEAFAQLCRWDPGLAAAVVDQPSFGLAEHAIYARELPAEFRARAAREMLERAEDEHDDYWTVELVQLVAELPPEESLPVLRSLWYDRGLRPAILPVLAHHLDPQDRQRFVDSLNAESIDSFQAAAAALLKSPGTAAPEDLAAALKALRRYASDRRFTAQRAVLRQLLGIWSGAEVQVDEATAKDPLSAHAGWFEWFAKAHPEAAEQLSGFGGATGAAWGERLAAVDWDGGDPLRGDAFFRRASCARCHVGRTRIGPELTNITQRLSLPDLFAAIVDPSRDVSPLYQSTLVMTADGKIYQGQLVYSSPTGTLLRTGLNDTIRIADAPIISQQPSSQSPMPEGLLNEAVDGDLADLYAYLKTLSTE